MKLLPAGQLCALLLACAFLLAACAHAPAADEQAAASDESPVPGRIGIAVAGQAAGVFISAVRSGSAAARAGVRVGDRVERLNGEPVLDARQFERRVLDSPPGDTVRLDLTREGQTSVVELPVEEISTALLV